MSNHQIRYIVHAFSLVIILSAYGLYHLINFKFKQKQLVVYTAVIMVFVISLVFLNNWIYDRTYKEFGPKNDELFDFLKAKPDPKFLLHAAGGAGINIPGGSQWYYNPDFVMFTFMRSKEGYNPFTFKQNAPLFEFQRDTPYSIEEYSVPLAKQLKDIAKDVPVYVAIFRYYEHNEINTIFGDSLLKNNFSSLNLTYWTVYYKE
jgi:hypothetical protein